MKNRRIRQYIEFNIDEFGLTDKDIENYAAIGLDLIKNDKRELANYAINHKLSRISDQLVEKELSETPDKDLNSKIICLLKRGE